MSTHTIHALLALLVAFALTACSDPPKADDGGGNNTPACPTGTLSCPCNADDTCNEDRLACIDGVCGLDGCPTGDEGCACFGNGTCAEGLECTDDLCKDPTPPDQEGVLDGPCGLGDTCGLHEGLQLVCETGFCRLPDIEVAGLQVTATGARACEIMLTERTGRIHTVEFGDAVQGEFMRRAPRVAMAFHADTDADLAGGLASVQVVGGGTDDIEISSVVCFDAQGAPLANAEASFQ